MILLVLKFSARNLKKFPTLAREVVGNLSGRKNVRVLKYQVTLL